jgi:hypothetical protein
VANQFLIPGRWSLTVANQFLIPGSVLHPKKA